jgi:predicted O-methyltransferase YrrM
VLIVLIARSKLIRGLAGIAETANFCFLKLLVRSPKRALKYPGLAFRAYASLGGTTKWRSADPEDLYSEYSGARITLEHLPGHGIAVPLEELAYLALITRLEAPRLIFEIGTFHGRTALVFAENSPDDCEVQTLDLPPGLLPSVGNRADRTLAELARPGSLFADRPTAKRKITQLYGDSTTFDFSPYFGRVDLVFVDGAHHYQAVRSDTLNALRMVRPGGVVLWHDFANYGDYNDVTRALVELVGRDLVQLGSTQLAYFRRPG